MLLLLCDLYALFLSWSKVLPDFKKVKNHWSKLWLVELYYFIYICVYIVPLKLPNCFVKFTPRELLGMEIASQMVYTILARDHLILSFYMNQLVT
jgi:hypothetical protein